MQLKRKSAPPLWEQIRSVLAEEIVGGTFPPGDQLPAEPELMERFEVSRSTVRRAMAELEDQGLVRVEQGRGTYVHDHVLHYRISKQTRFSENLMSQGRRPQSRVLADEIVEATETVARALGIATGSPVYRLARLRSADKVAILVGSAFLPAADFPGLLDGNLRHPSISAIYEAHGIASYVRLRTLVSTRMPSDWEARLLRQPRSRPVLVTKKVDGTPEGKPIGYGETVFAGDRVELEIDNLTAQAGAGFELV